ncbi:MAG TPA: glycosyltransferase family 39 protein [Candidatus Angelobacter sp.]|nr:glycosyltransferase family 39 protein [Candidatus Angelobacter sp.]
MNDRTRLLLLQVALVLGVCYFFFFFGLGAFGLTGADEPRYAQIAREMLARHDWVVPTLNGSPWLEKPVLLYWKIINSYRIFGVVDWAARVPAAAFATTLVLAIFFFMRRFRFTSELDAALITASSAGMIGFGRGASTDMLLSAPFAMAMLSWWTWQQTGKKLWLALFYALLGVGALAKGPVAPALAVLVIGAYAALRRDGKVFLRTISVPGLALFFAIALPWYLILQHRVPQFFRVFFLEHNLERFGTNLYQHAQPFWYYIPVFLLATVPWTVFTVPAIVNAAQRAIQNVRGNISRDPSGVVNVEEDPLPLFLLVWTLAPIVFFSISRSKLPGYILPSIPAAALLTADYLHRAQGVSRLKVSLHSLLCAVLMVGALMAPFALAKQNPHPAMQYGMSIFGAVIAVMVLLMVRREGVRVLHFVTLVPTILGLAFLLKPAAPVLDRALSSRAVQARLVELGQGEGPVAVFHVRRDIVYGLNFYRNQPITYYDDGPADMPPKAPPGPKPLPGKHLVIAPQGSYAEVQKQLGSRAVASIGDFPARRLEFFLVGAAK